MNVGQGALVVGSTLQHAHGLLNVHIAQGQHLLQRKVHQPRVRVGQENRLAARFIVLDVIPEDVEVLPVLRAPDIGADRTIVGDAKDICDGLPDFLVVSELGGLCRKGGGGNHHPAFVIKLFDLRRRGYGKCIAAREYQHAIFLAVLKVVQNQLPVIDAALIHENLGVQVGIVHTQATKQRFANVLIIGLSARKPALPRVRDLTDLRRLFIRYQRERSAAHKPVRRLQGADGIEYRNIRDVASVPKQVA